MDGISVCLVDDFGEPIDAHLIANVGRRKRRRALGDAELVGDPLVGLFGSDATNPYSFRIIQWNQPLGRSARSEYVQQTDSSGAFAFVNARRDLAECVDAGGWCVDRRGELQVAEVGSTEHPRATATNCKCPVFIEVQLVSIVPSRCCTLR